MKLVLLNHFKLQTLITYLSKLIEQANRNASRKKGGYRYATYFRTVAGPLTYDTIQRNLEHSVPSHNGYYR